MRPPRLTVFAVLSLACILAMALLIGLAFSSLLSRAMSELAWTFVGTIARHEAQQVGLAAMFERPDAAARERLGRELFGRLAKLPGLVRVKVWDREGVVLWSDNPRLIGRRFPENEELRAAVTSGEPVVELSDAGKRDIAEELPGFPAAAEIYVPLTSRSGTVAGALEIYSTAEPLLGLVRRGRVAVWSIAGMGSVVLYLLLLPVFRYAAQRQAGYTAELVRQVSERTRDLAHAQQRLVQQERLHALGQMASGVAHDFNNALTLIVGRAELLLDNPELLNDRERVARSLRAIMAGAKDAADTVGRLREFYRKRDDTEFFHAVDVNQLVEQAIVLTRPKWSAEALAQGKAIAVEKHLAPLPSIAANGPELREVLINLVLNAVDAMPTGGTMTFSTRVAMGQAEAGAPGAGSGRPCVLVEVQDTGTGMTDEVRRRCLEPFFSTKGERGSGLGLAMVFGSVTRHDGWIDVRSAPGQGTKVSVHLPIRETAQLDGPAAATPSRPLRVLLVDDDPAVRDVLAEYLRRDGHAVETAKDGRDGLNALAAGTFDLAIVDRAMPAVSGDQFAILARDMGCELPIILLTGFGTLMEAAGEKPPGVDLVVGKPVTLASFRRAVATVGRGRPGGETPG